MLASALALWLAAAPLTAQATQPPAAGARSPVLAPGDLLRVAVWRRPELSGDFPIAVDGTITHPLYRKIAAAGVPIPVLETRIRTFLLQFEANPEFVISPLFRVFVVGEVRAPGMLTVPPGTTLSQAIAMAGGPTEDARLDRVRLFRDLTEQTLDLTAGDSAASMLALRSSDQVTVRRQRRAFRDVILPTITFLGSVASLVNVIYLASGRR